MDPRVSISDAALGHQYVLAHRLTALMDQSYRDSKAAKAAGHTKAAEAFASLNADAASLLDTIDGADAPPTSQAADAVVSLEGQLRQAQQQAGAPSSH